jgi:hypothetical protein
MEVNIHCDSFVEKTFFVLPYPLNKLLTELMD